LFYGSFRAKAGGLEMLVDKAVDLVKVMAKRTG
jgi:hypothetical protein